MINHYRKEICYSCRRPATRVCYSDSLDDKKPETVFICDNADCLEKASKNLKIVSVILIKMS